MFKIMSPSYGSELMYSRRLNLVGRIVYAVFGETYPGYINRFYVNRRCLNEYVTSNNPKILEIGSANGAFAFWLSRNRKYNVTALEFDRDAVYDCNKIKRSLRRNNLFFICADASTQFPLSTPFDIIFSTHVLEHIQDDQSALINAWENLKPGGLLILQVPYGDPNKRPTKEAIANGHVRDGYTESDIRRKLEYAGFNIISTTGSVGRIGRFAYRFARGMAKVRIIVNFSILFFPITLILIYLEQVAVFFRKREPSFEHDPLIIARHPL